jgi:hypothetical protein
MAQECAGRRLHVYGVTAKQLLEGGRAEARRDTAYLRHHRPQRYLGITIGPFDRSLPLLAIGYWAFSCPLAVATRLLSRFL